jgi:hypothetical protein
MAWWRSLRDRVTGLLGMGHALGHRDLTPVLASLPLTLGGLGGLAWLAWAGEPEGSGWSWWWVLAVLVVIAGVILGAPVFSGKVIVAFTLAGYLLAGVGLVVAGTAHLSGEQYDDARTAATQLAYRLEDVAAAGRRGSMSDESLDTATDAVGRLCQAAGGTVDTRATAPCAPGGEDRAALRDLAVSQGRAELAVARAELVVATDDGRETAAAALAAARRSAADPEPTDVEVGEALTTGAGEVVGNILRPGERQLPLVFAYLGWGLVVAVGFALVRWTAVRNATRGRGPVRLEEPGDKSKEWSSCEEAFRTYLLENVPEPGTAPNAEALVKAAALVGETDLPQGKSLGAAVKAAVDWVLVPRGYAVQAGFLRAARGTSPPPGRSNATPAATPSANGPAGDGHEAPGVSAHPAPVVGVVVRVRKAYGRTLLGQQQFPLPDGSDALSRTVRRAAYWAAAGIIERSRSIPGWARWSPDTAGALADYFEAEDEAEGDGRRPPLEHLLRAERLAPDSGLILFKLAHAREQQGEFAAALAHCLDALRLYPRYLDARYRAASEAGLLASLLGGGQPAGLDGLVASLGRYAEQAPRATRAAARTLEGTLRQGPVDAGVLRTALLDLSMAERVEAGRQLRGWRVALNALRTSERDYWLAMLAFHPRRDRRDRLASADVVAHSLAGTADPREVERLDKRARRRDVLWQVPYNMACLYSQTAHYDDAAAMLERARLARANHQMTAAWVRHDPDLQFLATAQPDWFAAFVDRLAQAQDEAARGSGPVSLGRPQPRPERRVTYGLGPDGPAGG